MATLNEIAYNIKNLAYGGSYSIEESMDIRQIKFWINYHRANIIKHLVYAHQNVTSSAERFAEELRRFYYVTPKNYLDYISNYREQLKQNSKRITGSKHRLEGGLQKLIEASAAVDRMRITREETINEADINVDNVKKGDSEKEKELKIKLDKEYLLKIIKPVLADT